MATYDSFIFAGHGLSEVTGKYDPGATAQGAKENDLVRLFSAEAKKVLQSNPATKHLRIHYDEQNFVDNDLKNNTYKSRCGVSIHINAGGGTGTEVYVPCKEKVLDNDISLCSNISKLLNIKNRGVKSRDYSSGKTFTRVNGVALSYTDYYKEIREAWKLGISLSILEVGFIDTSDLQKMQSNVEEIGFEIAKYIAECNGIKLTKQEVTTPAEDTIYRIRKSWADSKSQKGAYKYLNNAIAECKKHIGYNVYDEKGKAVYSNVAEATGQASDPIEKEYAETGRCTIIASGINFRNKPYVDNNTNPIQGSYKRNEYVYYDKVVLTEKYVWISWISSSKKIRRYMPIKVRATGERWGNCI